MVRISTEFCDDCDEETQHGDGECGVCCSRKKRERIRVWNALDVDTRLTDLRERVERLEAGPHTC